jgi:hypothetical protein
MTNIPIDVGFSHTQAIREDKRIIFPTIYGEVSRSNFDLLGSQNGLDITTQDGSWMLGDAALHQSATASRPQADDWIFSNQYKAIILAAISELYAPTTHHISATVWTGLPYQQHQNEAFRNRYKSFIPGLYTIERFNRQKQTITIEDVKVLPQNFGPIYYWLLDDNGKKKDFGSDNFYVGSVNIGGNTVELATAEIDFSSSIPKIIPIHNQCMSEFGGVFTILVMLEKALDKRFDNETWKHNELLSILQTGKISLNNQLQDVSDITGKIKEYYQEKVVNLISNVWSKQQPFPLSRINHFICTGGGAYIVAKRLCQIRNDLKVSAEPQWDCVKGYEKLSKVKMK